MRRGEQAPSGDPGELTFTSETRDYRDSIDSGRGGSGSNEVVEGEAEEQSR